MKNDQKYIRINEEKIGNIVHRASKIAENIIKKQTRIFVSVIHPAKGNQIKKDLRGRLHYRRTWLLQISCRVN